VLGEQGGLSLLELVHVAGGENEAHGLARGEARSDGKAEAARASGDENDRTGAVARGKLFCGCEALGAQGAYGDDGDGGGPKGNGRSAERGRGGGGAQGGRGQRQGVQRADLVKVAKVGEVRAAAQVSAPDAIHGWLDAHRAECAKTSILMRADGMALFCFCVILLLMATKRRSKGAYMISAVAEMYQIHPQTLRLYEREGLLRPSRSEGNTRLYTDEDLERLEFILNLARDLGVNMAGIAIVLQMRERMEEMNHQMQGFVDYVRTEMLTRIQQQQPQPGLVPWRKKTVGKE
jgi:MerR family transcriptional regulator/heat shock protein HspR